MAIIVTIAINNTPALDVSALRAELRKCQQHTNCLEVDTELIIARQQLAASKAMIKELQKEVQAMQHTKAWNAWYDGDGKYPLQEG